MSRIPVVLLAILSLVACDDTVFEPHGGGSPDAAYTPDWDGVQALISDRCSSCHAVGNAILLPGALEDDLLGGHGALVVPGDPAGSLLWRVLSGTLDDGDYGVMPLGAALPADRIAHVRTWILAGAPIGAPVDLDGDGVPAPADCDDADPAVHPGAVEVCNGVDDDCDGTIDGPDSHDASPFYADADADGYGDPGAQVFACAAPEGHVDHATDCDDARAAVNPSATELCDGVDNDCDGAVDEDDAADATTWYPDADGDGYGHAGPGVVRCAAPEGYVANDTDCDDRDAAFHPGAPETDCADFSDYNCDGSVGAVDADGDGFAACQDCDDSDPDVSPDAVERCNGIDDDCDGQIDEAGAIDPATWYADTDADGFGDPTAAILACDLPSGFVSNDDDCDDARADVHPGADETCDGTDQDCDGAIDEDAIDAPTWYLDADGDGWGDASVTAEACERPSGYTAKPGDCDDDAPGVHPGVASDDLDGVDSDCDGLIDEDAYTYTHAGDIQPIWSARCTGCHGGSGGLSLSGDGWDDIVGVASTQLPSMNRITAGDPSQSYLWHKVGGTHAGVGGSGGRMPAGGTLSASDLEKIETWIHEGAPR